MVSEATYEAGGKEKATLNAEMQLALIENMIQEGRRTTEYWGWNFVLWGVAYLVAMTWAGTLTNRTASLWAWPVTMTATGLATALIARRRNRGLPVTTTSRAITSVWMGAGLGIFVFAFPTVIANRFADGHVFMGGIEVLLGVAHLASGITLRWRMQTAVGVFWWAAAVVTEVSRSGLALMAAFLTATFVCNIGFGAYLMVREARDKKLERARLRGREVSHV